MNTATSNHATRALRLCVALLWLGLAWPTDAGSPRLNNLLPIAGERGKTVEATFYGSRLQDATGVIFHTSGITAGDITEAKGDRAKATLTIAPDAPVGEHRLRIVTKSGVSEMVTFHVVGQPLVQEKKDEKAKNGRSYTQSTTFDKPQMIQPGTTIVGRTEAEDVDYFGVDLKKGQRLSVQIDGMRIGRGFTDSYLAVLDDKRFEIAVSDDTPLLRQDPYVAFIAPKDGRYVIVVRDSGYGGNDNNRYLMHVGSFPRPAAVYPLGGQPGEQVTLKFIGDAAGDFMQQVTLPDQPDNDFSVIPQRDGQPAPSGHAFRVNRLANVFEQDSSKNNAMGQLAEAPVHDVPVAFNGRVEQPGDMDYFKIRLKKNQSVTIRCYAGSMGSPLDSVVNIWRVDNKQHLVGNDDQGGALTSDSVVELKAPVDGDYFVRVRDHRNRGAADYVYRIEVTGTTPSLTTSIFRFDQNAPQSRQAIAVPRGNRFATLINTRRQGVGGALTPMIDGLPAGVAFTGQGLAEQGNLMPVVFEAAEDAPLDAKLVAIHALSEPRGDSAEQIRSTFSQRTPIVIGNPNRTEYAYAMQDRMPIAVTEQVPVKIDVVQPKAPLVRDGIMNLQVNVTRGDFKGRVRMYTLWRPNGLGAVGRVELLDDKTQAKYRIEANGGMPTRQWPMVIYGYAELPGGPVWISSQLFHVDVEEPFITGKIAKAKCTQCDAVDLVVNLEHPRDWTGEGELKLLGLPAGCEVKLMKIKPGQDKAVFRVQTAGNTPPGTHKSLMCELTIQINGEPVIHRMGRGGQLRIDRPRTKDSAQARSDNRK